MEEMSRGEAGREDQERREKENLQEQEKGLLKVITSCAVLSSSLHTAYFLQVATFPM